MPPLANEPVCVVCLSVSLSLSGPDLKGVAAAKKKNDIRVEIVHKEHGSAAAAAAAARESQEEHAAMKQMMVIERITDAPPCPIERITDATPCLIEMPYCRQYLSSTGRYTDV